MNDRIKPEFDAELREVKSSLMGLSNDIRRLALNHDEGSEARKALFLIEAELDKTRRKIFDIQN